MLLVLSILFFEHFPLCDCTMTLLLLHAMQIISGGGEAFVSHWSVNGDRRAHVPCSPTSIYHIAVNENSDSNKVRTKMKY